MNVAKGVVEKVFPNKAGYYGVLVGGTWYGAGKKHPNINQGDFISFTYSMNGKYANLDVNSIEKKESSSGAAPSVAAVAKGNQRDDYWNKKAEKDENVQASINWQAARNAAINAVGMMLQNDIVAVPAAKAKKYDVVMSLIDELSERYFYDTAHVFEHKNPPASRAEEEAALGTWDDEEDEAA